MGKNLAEIALCCTAFTQKFNMATKNGWTMNFWKLPQTRTEKLADAFAYTLLVKSLAKNTLSLTIYKIN